MRELSDLQKNFQHYLLQQNGSIESEIIDTPAVPASARLGIYREAYYLRLLEALQQDYKVLCGLLGDDEFDALGRRYIDHFPSSYRSIRWFGGELSSFLEKNHSQAWLVEMAQFEWLLTESFDAADAVAVKVEEIAKIPHKKWPELCFKLHPSFRKVSLYWNTVSIWKSFTERGKLISSQKSHQNVSWILWRKKNEIQFRSIEPDEITMLEAMGAGSTFAEICEKLCQSIDEEQVPMQAAIMLKRFVLDGLVSAISTEG